MFTTRHLVLLTGLRHIRRHKLRTVLTLFGVITGVATFIFAPTLAASISDSLRASIEDMTGTAQLEVRGPSEGFGMRMPAVVRAIDGVSVAAPIAQTGGVILGESEPLIFLGIDPGLDRAVRTYALAEGRFLDRPGGVLLTEAYAREKEIKVGQSIRLLGPGASLDLRVAGTLAASGVARLNSGDIAVMRIADAQTLRGDRRIDSISIALKPGREPDAVAESLRRVLPRDLEVDTAAARRGPIDDVQNIITFIMSFTSAMILAVGSTLVYNTMAVAVAQRRSEIGVLRALGVTRSGVRAMFLIESAAIGLIGSAIGVGVGYALVQSSGQAIQLGTIFSGAMATTITPVVPGWLPVVALIVGVAVPMLAGYLPSRAAARVDPVEAIVGVKVEAGFARIRRRRIAMAIVMLAASVVVLSTFTAADHPSSSAIVLLAQVVGTVVLMLIGVILLLPAILVGLGHILPGMMQRWLGVPGLLAAENLTKRSKHLASTGIVLLVGAWAAVVTSGSNFGYREFTAEWNASENVWDLTISGAGATAFESVIGLPAGLPGEIASRRPVAAAVAERIASIDIDGVEYTIRALDVAGFRAQGARLLWNEGDEAAAYRRLQERDHPAVVLSSYTAFANGVKAGDTITLETPNGPAAFEVVGTILGAMEPAKPTASGLVMDLQVYRSFWRDRRVDRLLVRLKPDIDAQAERRAIQSDYADGGIVVISPADLSASVSASIDNITTVSQVLSALLLITLAVGIANTLFIVVLDRRREMGMLRAVGLFGRQITTSLVLEAVALVIVTGILAVPLGLFTNAANSLTMQNIFAIRFTLAPGDVIGSLGLILGAAALATYVPARQAGRVDVIEALRWE